MRLLGVDGDVERGAGRARVRFMPTSQMTNPSGNVQSGILAAMLEVAMGLALDTMLTDDLAQRTTSLSITVLRTVPAGVAVVASAMALQTDPGWALVEAELADGDGRTLARGQSSKLTG